MAVISVITPIYNTEKLLGRCVDSILNQTFRDFALILVDDGSTDGSGRLCDELAARDCGSASEKQRCGRSPEPGTGLGICQF